MDNPPPFDFATTLPEDWIKRVSEWSSKHEWRTWYSPLAEYVRKRGDTAIHVDVIQDMARAATDPEAYPVTRWRLEYFFSRIRDRLSSDWPIRKVLQDFNPESNSLEPIMLGERLHCAIAELIALDAWMEEGWIPLESFAQEGPDWRLQRGDRTVAVEVKWRQHYKRITSYLDWAVKGQKMLPGFRWMNEFTWRWQPNFQDLSTCAEAMAWWLQSLPAIEMHTLNAARGTTGAIANIQEFELSIQAWGPGQPLVVRSTRPDLRALIELTKRATPDYFLSGSDRTYWPAPVMSEEEGKLFRESVVANPVRGAGRQVGNHAICCVLWTVPEGWEQAMTESWILDQLGRLSGEMSTIPTVVCPVGHIEWGAPRLFQNEPARVLTGT